MIILTPKEFCKLFKLSQRTFYNLIKKYPLKYCVMRVGGEWRVDLEKYIELARKEGMK